MNIPDFKTKQELFKFLKENKNIIIAAKKSQLKYTDSINAPLFTYDTKTDAINKAVIDPAVIEVDKFNISVVINTTNLMDSHSDVHIPNLWSKSLKEQKLLYLLQEHQMTFDHIISDEVKAITKTMNWSDLGFEFAGQTQALIFNCAVDKERNEYMAEQYIKDRVKNHSVGMRYVQLFLCMNSDRKWDFEEKANWDKYIEYVANKSTAEEQGYFWAVTEAKVIEGSAVPLGSNFATPTISVGKVEPQESTQEEPPKSTPKNNLSFILG